MRSHVSNSECTLRWRVSAHEASTAKIYFQSRFARGDAVCGAIITNYNVKCCYKISISVSKTKELFTNSRFFAHSHFVCRRNKLQKQKFDAWQVAVGYDGQRSFVAFYSFFCSFAARLEAAQSRCNRLCCAHARTLDLQTSSIAYLIGSKNAAEHRKMIYIQRMLNVSALSGWQPHSTCAFLSFTFFEMAAAAATSIIIYAWRPYESSIQPVFWVKRIASTAMPLRCRYTVRPIIVAF